MLRVGYQLPLRPSSGEVDRSQRDLDVVRRMQKTGVARATARAALDAGSDKAGTRGDDYVDQIIDAVWRDK